MFHSVLSRCKQSEQKITKATNASYHSDQRVTKATNASYLMSTTKQTIELRVCEVDNFILVGPLKPRSHKMRRALCSIMHSLDFGQ